MFEGMSRAKRMVAGLIVALAAFAAGCFLASIMGGNLLSSDSNGANQDWSGINGIGQQVQRSIEVSRIQYEWRINNDRFNNAIWFNHGP